jgi:hypothetical protein
VLHNKKCTWLIRLESILVFEMQVANFNKTVLRARLMFATVTSPRNRIVFPSVLHASMCWAINSLSSHSQSRSADVCSYCFWKVNRRLCFRISFEASIRIGHQSWKLVNRLDSPAWTESTLPCWNRILWSWVKSGGLAPLLHSYCPRILKDNLRIRP